MHATTGKICIVACTVLLVAALWGLQEPSDPTHLTQPREKSPASPTGDADERRSSGPQTPLSLPVRFERNVGQASTDVKFMGHAPGMRVALLESGLAISLPPAQPGGSHEGYASAGLVRLELIGATESPALRPEQRQRGVSNFLLGNDPEHWHTGVPHYGAVRYQQVYPGIDWIIYGNGRLLQYDFELAPHADARHIQLAIEGADDIFVDEAGDLLVSVKDGVLKQLKPLIYQTMEGGEREIVEGHFTVSQATQRVSFEVANYDRDRPLVIDPAISYSSYFGGTGGDIIYGIAVDGSGNIYVAGQTDSTDFPTESPVQPEFAFGFSDATVAKLDPTGQHLIYATYLGGSGLDGAHAIAVNSAGEAYVAGGTHSPDFPTVNALQPTHRGRYDPANAFIAKLDASGSSLLYSTYLGGSGTPEKLGGDFATGIAVDSSGNVYVVGQASSLDFPTASALQETNTGHPGAFVAALAPDGGSLVYSTYLTGIGYTKAHAIAVDDAGHAYVTGYLGGASDPGFPTVNAYQPVAADGDNAFVTKIAPDGSEFVYSTYLGGAGGNVAYGIALDDTGSAYVTGSTTALDFPTVNAVQGEHGGWHSPGDPNGFDAFVTKLSPDGSALLYSTFLGGDRIDLAYAIAVDPAGRAHVVGSTNSINFPLAEPLQCKIEQRGHATRDDTDGFIVILSPTGDALEFSTYLGGEKFDAPFAAAIGIQGRLHMAGRTDSDSFPTVSPLQSTNPAGYGAAFIATLENADRNTEPPLNPKGVVAVAGDSQISLAWDDCVPHTTYNVYLGTEPGGQDATLVESRIAGNSTVLSGLSNGATYYVRVAGVNAAGEGARSLAVSATLFLERPELVTGLRVSSLAQAIRIEWTPTVRATSYRVFVMPINEGETSYDVPGTQTSFVVPNLSPGQLYRFQIAGLNSSGLGPRSAIISATPGSSDSGGGGGGGGGGGSMGFWILALLGPTLWRLKGSRLN